MLTLTIRRSKRQRIRIGDDVIVVVIASDTRGVTLGVDAQGQTITLEPDPRAAEEGGDEASSAD